MDRPITATEANQRFSEILRDVQDGDSFVVTSRGRPVAKIVPIDDDLKEQALKGEAFLKWLEKQPHVTVAPWTREDLYD